MSSKIDSHPRGGCRDFYVSRKSDRAGTRVQEIVMRTMEEVLRRLDTQFRTAGKRAVADCQRARRQ